jgi:predicted DNA-binding protein
MKSKTIRISEETYKKLKELSIKTNRTLTGSLTELLKLLSKKSK